MSLQPDWEAWGRKRLHDIERQERAAEQRSSDALIRSEEYATREEEEHADLLAEEAERAHVYFDREAYLRNQRLGGHQERVHKYYVRILTDD